MQFFLCGCSLAVSLINSFWIALWKGQWGKTWALMEVLRYVIYLKVNWYGFSCNTNHLSIQKQGDAYGYVCGFLLSVQSIGKETSTCQGQALFIQRLHTLPHLSDLAGPFLLLLLLSGNWNLYFGINEVWRIKSTSFLPSGSFQIFTFAFKRMRLQMPSVWLSVHPGSNALRRGTRSRAGACRYKESIPGHQHSWAAAYQLLGSCRGEAHAWVQVGDKQDLLFYSVGLTWK